MTDPQFSAAPQAHGTDDPTRVMVRRCTAWVVDLLLFLAVVLTVFGNTAEYFEIDDEAIRDLDALIAAGDVDVDASFCDVLLENDDVAGCVELDDRAYLTSESDQAFQFVSTVAWFVLAHILLVGLVGASPGKLLLGLRVIDEQGRIAGIAKAAIRNVLWIVDGVPFVIGPVVGLITAGTSTGHRRVGDIAAKTYVVRSSQVGTPPFAVATAPGSDLAAAPPPQVWRSQPDTQASPVATPVEPDAPAPTWDPTAAPNPTAGWNPPVAPSEPTDIGETEPDHTAPMDEPAGDDRTEDDEPAGDDHTEAEPTDTGATVAAAPSAPSAPLENPPPQWDEARNTYLQWDANAQRWLQWDSVGNRWKPIDT